MHLSKKRIFQIIQIGSREDLPSTFFDVFISLVILLCVAATFLQTFDSMRSLGVLDEVELFTIIIFIVEYALRVWTADLLYPEFSPDRARLKFCLSFYGVIDLLTIVSFFVPFWFTSGIVALRMLRVLRIARLFRLSAEYDAFDVIFDVLHEKKEQIFSSVIMIVLLMFMSSMLMYSIEHDAQPKAFANGFSGLWWAVSTILTVGYGDIYPVTPLGKVMAIVIAFLGVGLVAMPTGIISAGFVEHYHRHNPVDHGAAISQALAEQQVAIEQALSESQTVITQAFTDSQSVRPYAVPKGLGASAPSAFPDDRTVAIIQALAAKQEALSLQGGCCPTCGTRLDGIFRASLPVSDTLPRSLPYPAYCPVCGQRIAPDGDHGTDPS